MIMARLRTPNMLSEVEGAGDMLSEVEGARDSLGPPVGLQFG
jgi:hypothetical protein